LPDEVLNTHVLKEGGSGYSATPPSVQEIADWTSIALINLSIAVIVKFVVEDLCGSGIYLFEGPNRFECFGL
jgi:hypothetical protein